jgi:hypothetical protein
MELDLNYRGLPSEFWLFGFVTAAYTNDWRTPAALVLFIEFGYNFFLIHGAEATTIEEATMLMYMATVVNVTVHFCGILLGLAFVYLTDFPKLLDFRIFYSDPQRARQTGGYLSAASGDDKRARFNSRSSDGYDGTPWRSKPNACAFFGLVVAVPLIYASMLLFGGFATDLGPLSITQEESNVIGGIVVAVGSILLLMYLVAVCGGFREARQPDAHDKADELNLKYSFLFLLALLTAAIFDFAPWSLGARYGATIGAAFLVYLITAVAGRYDRYLGTESAWRVYGTFFGVWLIHALLYAGSAFLTTLNSIFAWLAGWSLGLAVVFVVIGWVLRGQRDLAGRAARTSEFMEKEASNEVDSASPDDLETPLIPTTVEASTRSSLPQMSIRRRTRSTVKAEAAETKTTSNLQNLQF